MNRAKYKDLEFLCKCVYVNTFFSMYMVPDMPNSSWTLEKQSNNDRYRKLHSYIPEAYSLGRETYTNQIIIFHSCIHSFIKLILMKHLWVRNYSKYSR